jgi:hypothetical protein
MKFKAAVFLSVLFFLFTGGAGAFAQDVEEDIYSAVQRLIREGKDANYVVKTAIEMGSNAYEVVRYSLEAGADLNDVVCGALEAGAAVDVIVQGAVDAGVEPSAVEIAISTAPGRAAETETGAVEADAAKVEVARADAREMMIYEPATIELPCWGEDEPGLALSPSGF